MTNFTLKGVVWMWFVWVLGIIAAVVIIGFICIIVLISISERGKREREEREARANERAFQEIVRATRISNSGSKTGLAHNFIDRAGDVAPSILNAIIIAASKSKK